MVPARRGFRVATAALHAFVRQVGRVIGTAVIDDIIAFFRAFEGMEEGFRARADAVRVLLTEPATSFVLVTSARRDSIDEAIYFAQRLDDSEFAISALIANRVLPQFTPYDQVARLRARADALRGAAEAGPDAGAAARRLADRCDTLADLAALAAREHADLQGVAERMGGPPVAFVPFMAHDVHDVAALREVGRHLCAQ
jgi:anion-transporting  ArsA/GET3 family ATPase